MKRSLLDWLIISASLPASPAATGFCMQVLRTEELQSDQVCMYPRRPWIAAKGRVKPHT